jgi:hypothetical protein
MEIIGIVIVFLCIAYAVGNTVKKVSQNETASKLGLSVLERWMKK